MGSSSLPCSTKHRTTWEQLNYEFKALAPYFLSGGYIKVREDYRVYPTTIEFYFHSEKEDGVKDPIVYHRNNNKVKGKIPYFPIMTLHAHDSGYDITFENEKEQYRASVLIREYQIWDEHNTCWLKWDATSQQFCPIINGQDPRNTQVLYLKYILNSFAIGGYSCIDWINASSKDEINEATFRQNVPEFKKDTKGNYIIGKDLKYEKEDPIENAPLPLDKKKFFRYSKKIYNLCQRKWSFSRKNFIQ